MRSSEFGGCKLALIKEAFLLVYKRDEKENIPFPGMLDSPGGGREGNETPEDCVLRELQEEFGLYLDPSRLVFCETYTSVPSGRVGHFFDAEITEDEVHNISFGSEGVYWQMMPIQQYLQHPKAVPHLQQRLQKFVETGNVSYKR